jgi:hypothetical protein
MDTLTIMVLVVFTLGVAAILLVLLMRKPQPQATYHALEDAEKTVTKVLKGEKL